MRPCLTLTLTLVGLAWTVRAAASEWTFLRRIEGDVVVVTDVTAAGRLLAPPSPERPVYFKGLTLGNKFGSIGGDQEPDKAALTKFVTKLLHKQGFRGSPGDAHPPTQFLVLQWGYMSTNASGKLDFLGYDPSQDIGASPNPNLLGPEVFFRGMRTPEIQLVLDLANEPMYAVSITSIDYATANTAHPVALWQTRIGFSATGNYMANALPKMIAAAADQIGRATERPTLRDPNSLRKGEVTLGEMEIKDIDEAPASR
jgi:hypothetical protein